jgi:hypothetical protein
MKSQPQPPGPNFAVAVTATERSMAWSRDGGAPRAAKVGALKARIDDLEVKRDLLVADLRQYQRQIVDRTG